MSKDGKTSVKWTFAGIPSENWKQGFGASLLEYAQGTKDWDKVVEEATETIEEAQEMLRKRELAIQLREQEQQELILLGRRAKAAQIAADVDDTSIARNRRLPTINY